MNAQQIMAGAAVAAIGYVLMKKTAPEKVANPQSTITEGYAVDQQDISSGAANETTTPGNMIFNQKESDYVIPPIQGGSMDYQQTKSDYVIPPPMTEGLM